MNNDEKIRENIKNKIKEKYGTGSECARRNNMSNRYLNDTVNKIGKGIYPSMKFIKNLAEICDCDFTDFFKVG